MKNVIVISGDIIGSTSLHIKAKIALEQGLKKIISSFNENISIYGRIIKGDYIEIVVENPADALLIVLIIKTFIKSIVVKDIINSRQKNFKHYGVRLAMGFGSLERFNKKTGIIDGNAIYYSGRRISEESATHNKQRIVIKNTLFFTSDNEKLNETFSTIINFIDHIINNATTKQCEILHYRLTGMTEIEIAKKLNVKQPTINKQLSSVGWNSIDQSLKFFSKTLNNL
jgi:hypothetical protein